MRALIAVLPGDGVGPEVTHAAVRSLRAVGARFGHRFTFAEAAIGGAAIDAVGDPLPAETLEACQDADAVLLGAVGGPAWDDNPPRLRPERALLDLRRELGVFANIRPVRVRPGTESRSPLRPERVAGADIVIVRELTGGIYFGRRSRTAEAASDECRYTADEITRVARVAFSIARGRSSRVTSLDKANVLETSRLWRETVSSIAASEFPDVELRHQLIDSAAMQIVTSPRAFDVVLTENMFGDIISDEAAVLAGSLGLLGSASIGGPGPGLFEPIHGSAPDIAGRGTANPVGAIAAAAQLLDLGLGLREESRSLEAAIDATLAAGRATPDCGGGETTRSLSTAVARALLHPPQPAQPAGTI